MIAFGADGGRVDKCTECVKLGDRVQKNGAWIADPRAEYVRQQLARGTVTHPEPFKPKPRTPYDECVDDE